MPAERRGQVIGVGKEPTVKGKSFTSQRKAAAFVRWHEPDDARVSRPESVSGSGRNSPGRLGQVPGRVYAEVPQEASVRQDKASFGSGVSRSGATEGVPDRGRALMPDHVHMLILIPPKYSVAQIIGYMKGKSSIWIAQNVERKMRNFLGQKFWARGYFVTAVGRDEEVIRAYIRNQELADRQLDQFELKISAAQNPINRPNIP